MSAQHQMAQFSLEQVIRRFYECFKHEHRIFQQHLHDHQKENAFPALSELEQEQYTTLLLSRLMLLYFLQHKGLLANDPHYLSKRLYENQQRRDPITFYRAVLLPLFAHLSSARPPHSVQPVPGAQDTIPYLCSTLFASHSVERQHPTLDIADTAFARLFTFFDSYQWQLEGSANTTMNVLTPDILGYIFEQHVNQQQMGAYYTREDVSHYIASNTIIPAYLETLQHSHSDLFTPESRSWQQLRSDPDRYIHESVRTSNLLPGETTYEYSQRQQYYQELYERLRTGEIQSIDGMITYNLRLTVFACDMLANLEDEEIRQSCYQHLTRITILDPTCGSGAFLLAALNVLLPIYEASLTSSSGGTAQTRYTIIKTILSTNLYGVDIMTEAVEIAKLRLVFKLLAQAESSDQLEDLPSLDQTLQSGDALLPLDAATAEESSAASFCWYSAFPQVFAQGGFRVIIGNPPYVEHNSRTPATTLQHFTTYRCFNLYTCVVERSRQLLAPGGRNGMILPLAAFATRNMRHFLAAFRQWFPVTWLSFYHFRPSMLFSGGKVASIPTAIYLGKTSGEAQRFSTHLLKWSNEQRTQLFTNLRYNTITAPLDPHNLHYYPKLGHPDENTILRKVLSHQLVSSYTTTTPNQNTMYYRSAGGLYWKIFVNFPWPYATTSNKRCFFDESYDRNVFVALFNSSLFWWYYTVTFDTFNLKDYMLFGFRFSYPDNPEIVQSLCAASQRLMDDFRYYSKHLKRGNTGSYTIYARKSKYIIDAIDQTLAHHYGLSEAELGFILHYDLKYRINPPGEDNHSEAKTATLVNRQKGKMLDMSPLMTAQNTQTIAIPFPRY